ncbi:MAG: hypothetical protein GQ569_09230 [Methylococcaceae bacterium]|nr:hypothetical protein [Methylococcaceae bacterium]
MYAEIDDALMTKALRVNHSNDSSQLINTLLQDFIKNCAVKETQNQAEVLMAFSGKVKFEVDGLEYQKSIRDEWE